MLSNRHDDVAPPIAIEVGTRTWREPEPASLGPTHIRDLKRQGRSTRGHDTDGRFRTIHRVEGHVAGLLDLPADRVAVPAEVLEDRSGFFPGIDAEPEVVQGILNRLGLGASNQDRTGNEKTPHRATLGGLDENASGQHEGVHLRDAAGSEGLGCGPKRRPGGPHVIDEKHSPEPPQTPRCKGAGDVLLPFTMREIDLARCVAHTTKATQQCGDAQDVRHRRREKRSLVVAARPAPSPVKGDRDDRIDLARPSTRVRGHQRTKGRAKLTPPIVLESLNRIRNRTAVLEDRAWIGCVLNEGRTCGAKDVGAFGRFVTARTSGRRKKGQQAVEKIEHDPLSAVPTGGYLGRRWHWHRQ